VGALIRLGRKYYFKELLDSAVARLTLENPTTLEEFDAVAFKAPMSIVSHSAILIDMTALASENNLLSLLPSAYFFLVVGPSDEVNLLLRSYICV
jgi:hypothetical protein